MSPDGAHATAREKFDVETARREFPILEERVHDKALVYLDNANTTQKPTQVLAALDEFYRHQNANIHRATHQLSERATAAYEGARARSPVLVPRRPRDRPHQAARSLKWSPELCPTRLKPGTRSWSLVGTLEHRAWQLLAQVRRQAARVRRRSGDSASRLQKHLTPPPMSCR